MGRYVNSLLLLQLLQVESCRPQRTEPHLPTHAHACPPACAAKVLQWFPYGAPLFSRSRMDHLTPGKREWISPDRAPRSLKNSNVFRGHSLGRALARQNTRPDTVVDIKDVTLPDRLRNKKMRLNRSPNAAPRHAGAKLHQGFPPRPWVIGTQAKAGAGFSYPSGADSPARACGFQVKIPDSREPERMTATGAPRAPFSKRPNGPTPSSPTHC